MKVFMTPILPVRSLHYFLLPIILLSLAMSVPLFAFKSDKTSFKWDTGDEHATVHDSRKREGIRNAGKETAIAPVTPAVAGCPPLSTLPCESMQVALPVNLTFEAGVAGTLADKNGVGTGFRMVDAYSGARLAEDGSPSNTSVPGYEPSRLILSAGRLQLLSNKGIAYLANNNQLNTLGVKVDSRNKLQVETTLLQPYNGSASQQAGVWFGLNDKTFLKLVVTGNKVEMRREYNDASAYADQRLTGTISGLDNMTVRLRLVIDPMTNTAEGFYSTDGSTYLNVGASYAAPGISISGMGLTSSTAYTGIFATHRNSTTAVTYTFDNFTVSPATNTDVLRPYVTVVRPNDGATNVPLDQSVSVELAFPSGYSVEGGTANTNTVKLYTVINGVKSEVTGTAVNSTAGGDAITLSAALKASTTYEFVITDQVKDLNGNAMIPFTSRFTTTSTGTGTSSDLSGVSFTPQTLVDHSFGSSGFTTLAIGPDRRLYAAVSTGKIERWDIKADGTLQNHVTISPFGSTQRLLIGLRFDPAATSSNLVVWVSHSSSSFYNAPEWSGKISSINLNNPASPQVTDYVINLPRSTKDHTTNSIDFGSDGALYFLQGSNSALGAPDPSWGERPERLLTAAVLRLDIARARQQGLPLNVKTGEGGNYNPYANSAPLTIFATGIRNAYDLVWHSNGQLYVPTNGSSAGGNVPALPSGTVWSNGQVYTGPNIPAITDLRLTMRDYLFRVVRGGYYGHPNVLRNEYILNGGNPTSGVDPAEVTGTINGVTHGYKVGTPKEPNYRGFSYDFGSNMSPNGVMEYRSNAFDGKLKGKLLVCRFSGGDDIMVMEPGGTSLDIIKATPGIEVPGLRRPFANPLDIVEDVQTGNLYVSEYYDGNGDGRPYLTLLKADKPVTSTGYTLSVSTNGGGTVTKNPNQPTYASGTSVSLTATAAAGYQFSGWSGGATGTANPLVLTMNSNLSVTANFTTVTTTSCTASGTILREQWSGVSGSSVSDIPLHTSPGSTAQLTLFEAPTGLGSNYGARVRGYVCPPLTGNYTFFIASDDNSELWLSTTDSPANKVKIASVTGWASARQWDKYASQKSVAVRLEAGKRYYIEALHKQGWGGDNLAVGWQLPNGTTEAPIPGNRFSPYGSTTTTNQPPVANAGADKTITLPTSSVTLSGSGTDSDGTISGYSWSKVSGPSATLSGATTASLTASNLLEGTYVFRLRVTDNGGATAFDEAKVTVNPAPSSSSPIVREVWANVSGSTVAAIPVNTAPTSTSQLSLFEAPSNEGGSYGARVRAYVHAPATGSYVFWIASDDDSELWLSTDANPANKRKIAAVSGWTSSRQWEKYASQRSAAVTLQAGQKYYIEALHKEGWGDDNLAVGWQLPNGTQERPIPGNRLLAYLSATAGSALQSLESRTEPFATDGIFVVPNPFSSAVTIHLSPEASGMQYVKIVDVAGRNVFEQAFEAKEGKLYIALAQLPKGLYVLQLRDENGKSKIIKLIKQ